MGRRFRLGFNFRVSLDPINHLCELSYSVSISVIQGILRIGLDLVQMNLDKIFPYTRQTRRLPEFGHDASYPHRDFDERFHESSLCVVLVEELERADRTAERGERFANCHHTCQYSSEASPSSFPYLYRACPDQPPFPSICAAP